MRKRKKVVSFYPPIELREKLEALAEKDKRTLSNAIECICEEYFLKLEKKEA